jgi:hypothetical protein
VFAVNHANGTTDSTPISCALACFPVAKPHQKHQSGHTPANRAVIALHISADSIGALGLQPLDNPQDFYLPFGFIDVKEPAGPNLLFPLVMPYANKG